MERRGKQELGSVGVSQNYNDFVSNLPKDWNQK